MHIFGVPRRVPARWKSLSLTSFQMICWYFQSSQLLWRLNYSCGQPHLHVPINVAMEQLDSRIVGLESKHSIRVGIY